MDEAKRHEIRQWMIKAEHDIGSAKCLVSGNPSYRDTAVYHCQQAAEKALKAYLTLIDRSFQKIHDLSVLVQQCTEGDISFEQLQEAAEILTPYAVAFRYPGSVIEPDSSDAVEAIQLAESVIEFVSKRLPP